MVDRRSGRHRRQLSFVHPARSGRSRQSGQRVHAVVFGERLTTNTDRVERLAVRFLRASQTDHRPLPGVLGMLEASLETRPVSMGPRSEQRCSCPGCTNKLEHVASALGWVHDDTGLSGAAVGRAYRQWIKHVTHPRTRLGPPQTLLRGRRGSTRIHLPADRSRKSTRLYDRRQPRADGRGDDSGDTRRPLANSHSLLDPVQKWSTITKTETETEYRFETIGVWKRETWTNS